jgi:peptidoglycan LD-endopeptidase CwlK
MNLTILKDSELSEAEAKAQNPASVCPPEIWSVQKVLRVRYFGFDETVHEGQIVIHENVLADVRELFELLFELKFPIKSVIPVSDRRFAWDDVRSMAANNSSGFNFRTIMGTERISWHGYGRAIDINPAENPYVTSRGIFPPGAAYEPECPGTISSDSEMVRFMESRGWAWGGRWKDLKDYQHFEKHSPDKGI